MLRTAALLVLLALPARATTFAGPDHCRHLYARCLAAHNEANQCAASRDACLAIVTAVTPEDRWTATQSCATSHVRVCRLQKSTCQTSCRSSDCLVDCSKQEIACVISCPPRK